MQGDCEGVFMLWEMVYERFRLTLGAKTLATACANRSVNDKKPSYARRFRRLSPSPRLRRTRQRTRNNKGFNLTHGVPTEALVIRSPPTLIAFVNFRLR